MNKRGFTLLEVTLFLAISSGMAVIAFVGLGPRLRNVRFTDSVKSTEATIKNQFASSVAGRNQRPTNFTCAKANYFGFEYPLITAGGTSAAGSTSGCVVNGKLVVFEETRMAVYSIVSLREPLTPGCLPTDLATLTNCYRPRVARGVGPGHNEPPYPEYFNYQSGVTAASNINAVTPAPAKPSLAFGYVQDPNGTTKYQFFHTFVEGPAGGSGNPDITIGSPGTATQSVARPFVCLKLDTRTAEIAFSSKSLEPKVEFKACSV